MEVCHQIEVTLRVHISVLVLIYWCPSSAQYQFSSDLHQIIITNIHHLVNSAC